MRPPRANQELIVPRPTSYSGVAQFHECPRKYWLANVMKVVPPDAEVIERRYAQGSYFHQQIATALKIVTNEAEIFRQQHGHPPPFDVVRFASTFRGLPVPEQWRDNWERMVGHTIGFLQTIAVHWALWTLDYPPMIETPFALDRQYRPIPWDGNRSALPKDLVALRGFLDLGFLITSKELVLAPGQPPAMQTPAYGMLIDWKTGIERRRSVLEDGTPDPQLALYALAMFLRWPWLDHVKATFHNVRWAEPEPWVIIRRDDAEDKAVRYVEHAIDDMMNRDPYNQHSWEGKENRYCATCEYREDCPVFRQVRRRWAINAAARAAEEAGD